MPVQASPLNTQGPISAALFGPSGPSAEKRVLPISRPSPQLPVAPTATSDTSAPSAPIPSNSSSVPDSAFYDLQNSLLSSVNRLNNVLDQPEPSAPTPPVYQSSPPVQPSYNPIHSWGSTAMMLALIGSAFTRQPITAALNAGSQVMKAYSENNAAAAANAIDAWKTQTANALNLYKYQQDAYHDAITSHQDNERDAIAAVTSLAASFKDGPMAAAAQTGGLQAVVNMNTKRGKAAASLADTSFNLDNHSKIIQSADTPDSSGYSKNQWISMAQNALSGGKPPLFASGKLGNLQKEEYNKAVLQIQAGTGSPDSGTGSGIVPGTGLQKSTISALGQAWAKGVPLNKLTEGFSGDSQTIRADIENEGINWLISQGKDPTSFIVSQANYVANQQSLDQMTKNANSASQYENTTLDNMNVAQKLASEGGIPSNISPILNQIASYGEVKYGSPQTMAYGAALMTVMTEYAKVMSGGTGSVAASSDSAREEAQGLISQFGTQAQADAVFNVMRKDMQNKIKNYSTSISAIQNALQAGQSSVQETESSGSQTDAPTSPTSSSSISPTASNGGGGGWRIQQVP